MDFTLRDERQIDEVFLRTVLGGIAGWVSEQSGLVMPATQVDIDVYRNTRGRISCQAKVAYRGPVSPTSGGWPKIKLDLAADEQLVLPPANREVFHPYSDRPAQGIWATSYAYEEAFGEKLRALGERTRPRDLYDVVNLYRRPETRPPASLVRDVLRQKCEYKGVPLPTVEGLAPQREAMKRMWEDMLGHQLPFLPPMEGFWEALPEVFDWVVGGAEIPRRVELDRAAGEVTVRARVLPIEIPGHARSTIEIIRFAASNHLCVDLTYDGTVRRIEPYSLRRTAEGDFVLHAVTADSGEHSIYKVDRMGASEVTARSFAPRYAVELTATVV